MKRTLLVLAVLCVAGIFSAKAQSASDSAYARDLSYVYFNTSSLPATATGQRTPTSKILKDIAPGYAAEGYAINLSQATMLDIRLTTPAASSSYWDCYLFLLDANYNIIAFNDDYYFDSVRGSRIISDLPAGTYYVLVTSYNSGRPSSNQNFTLYMAANTAVTLRSLTYNPISANTNFTDTLGSNSQLVSDSITYNYNGHYPRCKGYSVQVQQPSALTVSISRSNRKIIILDNNYNLLASGYRNSSYNITTAGTYRIVIASGMNDHETDTTLSTPYTMNIRSVVPTPLNSLTYTPLGMAPDTTVYDTFASTFPYVSYDNAIMPAKGYSFQASQNSVISFYDNNSNAYFVLMDNNYNVIGDGYSSYYYKLSQTGTYYVAILDAVDYESEVHIKTFPYNTLYVDGVNGNDSRNGLTPNTALKTLDTAIARTTGIGRYYLTDDYTFDNSDFFYTYYAEIYPYGKDIHLKITNNPDVFIYYMRDLVFGSQDSSHYIIIDSCHTDLYYGLFYGDQGSHIELNKVKVRNSYFPYDFITYADDVVLRDCEFSNDTIFDDFIQIDNTMYKSAKLIDVDFTQNYLNYYFIYSATPSEYRTYISLENTNVVGNTFIYPQLGFWKLDADLKSGSWRNNNLESAYSDNGNPNLSTQNCAGIWAMDSTIVNIGSGFTMDANNYICLNTTATINITENLTAPLVAQVYPLRYDDNSGYYIADYYEGRTLLTGSASMLRANYQKFSVAQADNTSLWYLHPDGTIHSYSVGIETAENSDIRIYPNPASDKVTIDLQNTTATEICLMDIYGKTVVRKAVNGQSEVIDLGSLAKGMYFVQIRNNSKVEATQKLIKK